MPAVLVVDPDQHVLSFLRPAFLRAGFEFLGARRTADIESRMRRARPVVVVSRADFEVLEAVRPIPVLLLGFAGQEEDLAGALEAGAADIALFPLDADDVVARVRNVLQWSSQSAEPEVLTAGPVTLDLAKRSLVTPAAPLTPGEFHILRWLLDAPGRPLTRRQLADVTRERTVDVHVASLRRKLGPAGECIETLRGIGYRFRSA